MAKKSDEEEEEDKNKPEKKSKAVIYGTYERNKWWRTQKGEWEGKMISSCRDLGVAPLWNK